MSGLLGVGAIIESVGKVADELFTSDKEREELRLQEKEIDQRNDLAQIDLNKTEAATGSLFIGGWRPAIGWTCATALFCYYVPYVLVATGLWAWQVIQKGELIARPDLGIADLIGLVLSMLGMSALRTKEKLSDKAK
jgi:hypothetical protein